MEFVAGKPNWSIKCKHFNAKSTDNNILKVGHDDRVKAILTFFFTLDVIFRYLVSMTTLATSIYDASTILKYNSNSIHTYT